MELNDQREDNCRYKKSRATGLKEKKEELEERGVEGRVCSLNRSAILRRRVKL